MSHHGTEGHAASDDLRNEMRKQIARMEERSGATGEFPHGKLNHNDEGELAMIVGADEAKGVVFIDFGKSIRWFAMTPTEVDGLIALLEEHKKAIR